MKRKELIKSRVRQISKFSKKALAIDNTDIRLNITLLTNDTDDIDIDITVMQKETHDNFSVRVASDKSNDEANELLSMLIYLLKFRDFKKANEVFKAIYYS